MNTTDIHKEASSSAHTIERINNPELDKNGLTSITIYNRDKTKHCHLLINKNCEVLVC